MSGTAQRAGRGDTPSAESGAAAREDLRRRVNSPLPRGDKRRYRMRGKGRRRTEKIISRREGSKTHLTNLRRAVIAKTGMLPLDFLTAVYRDELYDRYEQLVADDGKTIYFAPTKHARRIPVDLDQRLSAATSAAPYVHRKMPQGVEIADKGERAMLAQMLRALPPRDLEHLGKLLDKIETKRLPPSLKGAVIAGARTMTQDGDPVDE